MWLTHSPVCGANSLVWSGPGGWVGGLVFWGTVVSGRQWRATSIVRQATRYDGRQCCYNARQIPPQIPPI